MQTFRMTPWRGICMSQRTKQSGQRRRPRLGFECMIKMFEQAKTFHTSEPAAAVIGWYTSQCAKLFTFLQDYFYIVVMQLNILHDLRDK